MTDAGLNLKLARMRGLGRAYIANDWGEQPVHGLVWSPPTVYWFDEHEWHDFDAIHNGADFDAVLMWARKSLCIMQADREPFEPFEYCEDYVDLSDTEFRRAVCEAIVEAGDATQ